MQEGQTVQQQKWFENMTLRSMLLVWAMILIAVIVLAGCGKNSDEGKAEDNPAVSIADGNDTSNPVPDSNASSNDGDGQKVNYEIETNGNLKDAPADQGDSNVWIKGKARLENERVSVTGTTNLLPGVKMKADITATGYNMWGYNDEADIGRDGTFQFDIKKPNIKEGTLDITISFVPEEQAGEVEAYGKDGNKLTGPYIHQYEKSEQIYKKAVAFIRVGANPESADEEWEVEIPGERPEDYGSPDIWITPVISFDGTNYQIKAKSNLLEGVRIKADVDIPDHWNIGYGENAQVMPDGAFSLQMKKPKNVDTFYIVLRVVPAEDMPKAAKEGYGVKGEKFDGELVKAEQSDQGSISVIQMKIKIKDE
ncbi:hypothetical protein [Paenibacillus bouchesdurhonensis]|uniref:hypothetical protein n=1 Tax=Paenibacillus bouchesdurhonensis TaxID=1870990 RepID=UPI000DA5EF0B|nr:hypothetical protein [Paenibacillus bouchesdurhonensis]